MCPALWVLSFSLNTFTSDSHTPHACILQCLVKDILIIQSPRVPTHPLPLSLVSTSVPGAHPCGNGPFLTKAILTGITPLCSTSVWCIILNAVRVSQGTDPDKKMSVRSRVRENEWSRIHNTVSKCSPSNSDAGQLQDCGSCLSQCWDWCLKEQLQEVDSGPQCRRYRPRKQEQGQLCLLSSHRSGSRDRGMPVFSWFPLFPLIQSGTFVQAGIPTLCPIIHSLWKHPHTLTWRCVH